MLCLTRNISYMTHLISEDAYPTVHLALLYTWPMLPVFVWVWVTHLILGFLCVYPVLLSICCLLFQTELLEFHWFRLKKRRVKLYSYLFLYICIYTCILYFFTLFLFKSLKFKRLWLYLSVFLTCLRSLTFKKYSFNRVPPFSYKNLL
jgi:hypothetical protein